MDEDVNIIDIEDCYNAIYGYVMKILIFDNCADNDQVENFCMTNLIIMMAIMMTIMTVMVAMIIIVKAMMTLVMTNCDGNDDNGENDGDNNDDNCNDRNGTLRYPGLPSVHAARQR